MSAPKGYSSQEKEDRLSAQFQTIEPVREKQFGSTVVSHQFVFQVEINAIVGAGSTASVIQCVGHQARKGDVLYFLTLEREAKVWETTANTISLAETLPSAPGAGDIFEIRRHRYPLVDSAGTLQTSSVEVATAGNGNAAPTLNKIIGGVDISSNLAYPIRVDSTGLLQAAVVSSDLPTGAATEATLATLATEATVATLATESTLVTLGTEATALDTNGKVGNIETTLTAISAAVATEATLATLATEATVSTLATEATLSALNAKVTVVDTGNVTVVSSSLPTGAATEATLATLATEATVSTLATEATLSALSAKVIEADTDNVTIVSSVLPTGAATEATLGNVATSANQTNGSQKSQIVDGAGDIVDVVALNVALQATDKGLVTNTIIHGETTGGGGGYVDVKVTPSGAMVTETTLAGLDAAVLGQDTMANSLPVVLASDQTAIPVTDNGSSLTVDGTVAVSAISAALPSGTNTIGKVDVNTLSVIDLLDAGILDTSSTNIPGSASNPVQVVASTAAATKKLQLLDTTGAFVGVYTGAALSEVLQFVMGPGSDQTIEHSIPASTRISLKRLDSTTAVSSGILAINFIG